MLPLQAHACFNSFSAAASKGRSKTSPRRLLKTRHKSTLTKRVRVDFPVRPSFPVAFRIQRLKISLPLLKRMLKRSRIYKKIVKSQIDKATGHVEHLNKQMTVRRKNEERSWPCKISSTKFIQVDFLFESICLLHAFSLTRIELTKETCMVNRFLWFCTRIPVFC